jgi:hypothetical protein
MEVRSLQQEALFYESKFLIWADFCEQGIFVSL